MDLEKISAELRPRRTWEAVDLGISLARQHAGRLLLLWAGSVLPLIVLLSFALWSYPQLLVLVIWWLKPLYDRVPLFYLSRALFGSAPTVREFYRALPKLWAHRAFDALVTGRFSIVRSAVMPVKQLEGLRGAPYRTRRDVLLRSCASQAQWFTALCLFFEHLFTFALILFATSAIPVVAPPDPVRYVEFLQDLAITGDFSYGTAVVVGVLAAWVLALTFVEHLYVAGGFALYLNARTHLDGWDVELTFKRIANRVLRLDRGGLPLLLALALTVTATSRVDAAPPSDLPPDAVIEEVLAHEDFEIHTRTEKFRVDEDGGTSLSLGFLEILGLFGFWVIVALLVIAVVMVIYKNRHYFAGGASSSRRDRQPIPQARTILGMEIGADSLPSDLVDTARRQWREGQVREALSLLYRGAISWMVESAHAPIRDSDTELDCLHHARATDAARGRLPYLEALTATWIDTAYGSRPPEAAAMDRLFDTWPFHPEDAA